MKYKIEKFDGGGRISFTPLSNRPTQQRAQTTQQEAKKDPNTIIEEEMYKELIKGGVGLRSDINK